MKKIILLLLLLNNCGTNKRPNTDFDFITNSGIRIKLSPIMNNLTSEEVGDWTNSIVDFWCSKKDWNEAEIRKELRTVDVLLYDEYYVVADGIIGVAITRYNNEIIISTLPKPSSNITPYEKVKSLYRHELSHIIVGKMATIPYTELAHHKLFEEVGLGA